MTIDFRPAAIPDDRKLLADMDALCFPVDEPPHFEGAHWFIGWASARSDGTREPASPAAYCAWKPVDHDGVAMGFHYRAGVMPDYRGHALQRRMIRLREDEMRAAGLRTAVTYTDADAAASMRNLIAEGYRPYAPTPATTLSGLGRLGRVGFVHWRKSL
jgi:GNAT superfamily N-acetyltransferase